MKLDKARTLKIIKAALKEDIGPGDITATSTVGKTDSIKAAIVTHQDCILCGVNIAEWIINVLDLSVRFKPQAGDGQHVYEEKEIIFLEGHARSILSAERTMLNFLSFLSAIATRTNRFAEKARKYGLKIYDTRKTFPLLRYLEKYAVSTGGGHNHRKGLWDQVLIKENHIKAANLYKKKNLLRETRNTVTKNIKLEIEAEDLDQFKSILSAEADIIMLDNMNPDDVRKAVHLRDRMNSRKKPLLEVSGGITLDSLEDYARTGVDRVSVGSLTNSVQAVDMSLEMV